MKTIITLTLLFSTVAFFATAQNYNFSITPIDGKFQVLIPQQADASYPRIDLNLGQLDTTAFINEGYIRMAEAHRNKANDVFDSFFDELFAQELQADWSNYVAFDYEAYAATRWANAFDGNYLYEVRGSVAQIEVFITGNEIRRTSNNNLLATFQPLAANNIVVTVQGSGEVIELAGRGIYWVGRNSANQIVTLKRQ